MEVFSGHILEWLVLLILLGGAIYTLRVIGQEKSTFKEECYEVSFGNLVLMIPRWWTITEQSDQRLRFERTDTRYDWFATFEYFPSTDDPLPLPQVLEQKLNLDEIEFDEDVTFETDSRVVFRDSKIQEHFQEMIRVEGKGSQRVVERIYYDIFLLRGLGDQGHFIFESWSSVLNGSLEGPFFEESLAELRFVSET